jgi:hypothetical protein
MKNNIVSDPLQNSKLGIESEKVELTIPLGHPFVVKKPEKEGEKPAGFSSFVQTRRRKG